MAVTTPAPRAPSPPAAGQRVDGPARVLIIGCGRSHRRDDQLGLLVAERLSATLSSRARVLQTESPGADLLTELAGVELLIVIDAARGLPPGSWRRFERFPGADGSRLEFAGWDGHPGSCHALGVADALVLGDRLGLLPREVWIYAVAGSDFGYGAEISASARPLIGDVAAAIAAGVASWCARAHDSQVADA